MIVRSLDEDSKRVEKAQSEVRAKVLMAYFAGWSWIKISGEIKNELYDVQKALKNEELKKIIFDALIAFAFALWHGAVKSFGLNGQEAANEIKQTYKVSEMGIPTQKYSKRYMEDVKRKLTKLSEIDATVDGHTLRNRAEMEVRYEFHTNQIQDLKSNGVKLVICSTHADASDRCAPWQGRIYSLDGTKGKTEDGKPYQPLENATDHFYTTKQGRTYKNGLLGFNCRHYLREYKTGEQIPFINKATIKKEYEITETQRAYERKVRNYREQANAYEIAGLTNEAKIARAKAADSNNEYRAFSREHERAYYPDRVQIFEIT